MNLIFAGHSSRSPRRALAAAVTLLLPIAAGCSLSQPNPVKGEFGIVMPPAPASAVGAPALSCLRVERINIAPPFDQQSFSYRIGDNQFETDYYNQFVAPPDRLFTGAAVRALTDRAVASTVLEPAATADCSLRLETSITDLYADMRPEKRQVIIRARFMLLRDQAGATTIVGSWPIESAETMLSPSPADIAAAYGRAYAAMMTRLAREIAAARP